MERQPFWVFLLLGILWASLLIGLGFLDIQPVTLRILLLPALGLPAAIFNTWADLCQIETDRAFYSEEQFRGIYGSKDAPIIPDRITILKRLLWSFVGAPILCFMGAVLFLGILDVLGSLFNIRF